MGTRGSTINVRRGRGALAALAALLMAVGLVFALSPATSQTAWADDPSFSGGDGSESSPYQIMTAGDLQSLGTAVNSGNSFAGKYFVVTGDIDLAASDAPTKDSWTPIGCKNGYYDYYSFSGTFDGGKHRINFNHEPSDSLFGLFGSVKGANITGVVITGSITSASLNGKNSIAGLVGYIDYGAATVISECGNEATVNVPKSNKIAGLVGSIGSSWSDYPSVSISRCFNTGSVSGGLQVAGILASGGATISSCYNAGTISSRQLSSSEYYANVGGILGERNNIGSGVYTKVVNCVNAGAVNGTVNASYSSYAYYGAISGDEASGDDPKNNADANYWLVTSCGQSSATTPYKSENQYNISKTAAELASVEFVATLNDGEYAGAWKSIPAIATAHPVLAWQDPGLPVIADKGQPVSAAYQKNDNNDGVTPLSVTATAANGFDAEYGVFTYAWYECDENGNVSGDALSTAQTYKPSIANTGTKYYLCRVTVSGKELSTDSAPAKIEVYATAAEPPSGISVKMASTGYTASEGVYTVPEGSEFTLGIDSATIPTDHRLKYQWTVSTDGGSTYSPIEGAFGSADSIEGIEYTATADALGSYYYRCQLSAWIEVEGNIAGPVDSTNAVGVTVPAAMTIDTPGKWNEFASGVNDGTVDYTGKTVVLAADIDFTGGEAPNYVAAGTTDHPFKGKFDGGNHTLTLNVNESSNAYAGAFGCVSGDAEFSNVVIAGSVSGRTYVGGLIGTITDGAVVITKCANKADVEGITYVGGLVGQCATNDSFAVTDCYNVGAVTATAAMNTYAGGIVGYHYYGDNLDACSMEFTRCYNAGIVSAKNKGALAGQLCSSPKSSFTDCVFLDGTANKGYGGSNSPKDSADATKVGIADLRAMSNGASALGNAFSASNPPIANNGFPRLTWEAEYTGTVYSVTFDADGGTLGVGTVSPTLVAPGATVAKPVNDPTRDDCDFNGWLLGDTAYSFDTAVNESIALKASWTATYAISSASAENGSFTVKVGDSVVTRAAAGETVTVKANPSVGYKLDAITVSKSEGAVDVAATDNTGEFTFIMPGEAVTVAATFIVDPESDCVVLVGSEPVTSLIDGKQYVFVADGKAMIAKVGDSSYGLNGKAIGLANHDDGKAIVFDSASNASLGTWTAEAAGNQEGAGCYLLNGQNYLKHANNTYTVSLSTSDKSALVYSAGNTGFLNPEATSSASNYVLEFAYGCFMLYSDTSKHAVAYEVVSNEPTPVANSAITKVIEGLPDGCSFVVKVDDAEVAAAAADATVTVVPTAASGYEVDTVKYAPSSVVATPVTSLEPGEKYLFVAVGGDDAYAMKAEAASGTALKGTAVIVADSDDNKKVTFADLDLADHVWIAGGNASDGWTLAHDGEYVAVDYYGTVSLTKSENGASRFKAANGGGFKDPYSLSEYALNCAISAGTFCCDPEPDAGHPIAQAYKITSPVSFDATTVELEENAYTFTMPANDVVVAVAFKRASVATSAVTFTVTDGTNPINGATVTVSQQGKDDVSGTTDADGKATLDLPQGAECTYSVSATNFQTKSNQALTVGTAATQAESVVLSAAVGPQLSVELARGKEGIGTAESYEVEHGTAQALNVHVQQAAKGDTVMIKDGFYTYPRTDTKASDFNNDNFKVKWYQGAIEGDPVQTDVLAWNGTNPAWGSANSGFTFTATAEMLATPGTYDFYAVAKWAIEGCESATSAPVKFTVTVTGDEPPAVDKTALQASITAAEQVASGATIAEKAADVPEGDKFNTAADKATLEAAITAAKSALNAEETTQNQIDAAKTALDAAVKAFNDAAQTGTKKASPEPEKVNWKGLPDAVAAAKKLEEGVKTSDDGSDIETTDKWVTADVKRVLDKAIADAEAVLAKEDAATQAEVDKALADLNAAKNAFRPAAGKKAADKPEPEKKADLSKATIAAIDDQPYTAAAIEPALKVTLSGKELKAGTDYEVAYKDNTEVGTATATITGTGSYKGKATATFKIVSFAVAEAATEMTDLKADEWYMGSEPGGYFPNTKTLYLDYTLSKGLMSGFKDANGNITGFGPNVEMNRAQAAVIIYRMANPDSTDTYSDAAAKGVRNTTGMSDVEDERYYTAAVNWAVKNNVITGYTDPATGKPLGLFGPNDPISREQLATIIGRYMDPEGAAGKDVSNFADAEQISDFAKGGIAYCNKALIMTGLGTSGNFGPSQIATRCQMAKIIAVTDKLHGEQQAKVAVQSVNDLVVRAAAEAQAAAAAQPVAEAKSTGLVAGAISL